MLQILDQNIVHTTHTCKWYNEFHTHMNAHIYTYTLHGLYNSPKIWYSINIKKNIAGYTASLKSKYNRKKNF